MSNVDNKYAIKPTYEELENAVEANGGIFKSNDPFIDPIALIKQKTGIELCEFKAISARLKNRDSAVNKILSVHGQHPKMELEELLDHDLISLEDLFVAHYDQFGDLGVRAANHYAR